VVCLVWYLARSPLWELQSQMRAAQLTPVAALIDDNRLLVKELQGAAFVEPQLGILASYLAKIRRDGVPRHADMKQRLDRLAENNTAIVTLVNAYAGTARTAAFTLEANKFRTYAAAWRDRWNSVMELFMIGGNYAAAEVPFPDAFPAAIAAELAAQD
jgi:hypothetical protein